MFRLNRLLLLFISFAFVAFNLNAQEKTAPISDIDGNKYETVIIGDQQWMLGNLKVTRFNDGTDIPNITEMKEWVRTTSPAYCFYDNDISNKEEFGGLYNWRAVNTGKLCPKGWRVPTNHDWTVLIDKLGGVEAAVKKLEEIGFFVAPGGYRYGYFWGSGIFYEKGTNGYWWTSTKATDTHIWSRTINSKSGKIYQSFFTGNNGFYVKCIAQESNGTVKDIDGNVYHTVVIGQQEWMLENLKATRYNDGTPIRNLTDTTEWRNEDVPGYVWYNNDISNKDIYGALYNGFAVANNKKLAPEGWHVATDDDWKELEMYMGMSREQADGTVWRGTNQGGKLKMTGTNLWQTPNKGATNESGLAIIPSGRRDSSGKFYDKGTGCTIWTSTGTSMSCTCYRHFSATVAAIGRNPEGDKKFGFVVRCVKNR